MGIKHMTDLNPMELNDLVYDMIMNPDEYQASEKIDGTLNASMYMSTDHSTPRLTRSTKGQPAILSKADIPKKYSHNGHRFALAAFEAVVSECDINAFLTRNELEYIIVEHEILLGARPNTIKYERTCIIPLRVVEYKRTYQDDRTIANISLYAMFSRYIAHLNTFDAFTKKFKIEYDEIRFAITPDFELDIISHQKNELFEIKSKPIYDTELLLNTWGLKSCKLVFNQEDLNADFTKDIINKLNEGVIKLRSKIGSCIPEGVVIHKHCTGEMFKVVNKEHFTRANNFIWDVRSQFVGGRVKDGKWRKSLYTNMLEGIASDLNVGILKTPMMKKYIKDAIDGNHEKAEEVVTKIITALEQKKVYNAVVNRIKNAEKVCLDLGTKYEKAQGSKKVYDDEVNDRTVQCIVSVTMHIGLLNALINKLTEVQGDERRNLIRHFVQLLVYI